MQFIKQTKKVLCSPDLQADRSQHGGRDRARYGVVGSGKGPRGVSDRLIDVWIMGGLGTVVSK